MQSFKLFSAASLIATMGVAFTACSNDEVVEPQAPKLTGETVKTQFALSLPQNLSKSTRMTEDNTQADNQFNGMTGLRLYGFASTTGGVAIGTNAFSSFVYKPTGDLAAFEALQSKYYDDVEVPVGINNFLFYGKQVNATPGFDKGRTDASWDATPSSDLVNYGDQPKDKISFSPVQITQVTDFGARDEGKCLLALLAQIEAATDGATAWRDEANQQFSKLYAAFTNPATPYGGSSQTILKMLEDLYNSVGSIKGSPLAEAIKTAITKEVTSGTKTLQIKATAVDDKFTLAYVADPQFPNGIADISLPDGAAKVQWAEPTTVATPKNARTVTYSTKSIDGLDVELRQYVYPAELYYYVNSPIKVSTTTQKDQRGGGYTTWNDFLVARYTEGDVVSGSTKSVALVKPAQYGVAHLKLTAKLDASTLDDNDTDGKKVDVADGFKLIGVLVGDQKAVNWDFTQNLTAPTKVVYDKNMAAADIVVKAGIPSTPNHTLVYESKGVTGTVSETNDDVVNIAIELQNGDKDFFGQNGMLIPAQTRFYLVGQVKLSALTDAERNGRLKVFEQDYTTELNLKIMSLKNAYNTVPDLRSPKLELGLAVDVAWQKGVTAEITIK